MCTDHVKTTPTLSTIVYIMSILSPLCSSDFVAIFGNVHRPYKQYPNIVNNSVYYNVSIFFPNFLATFALLTIFGNAHKPCEQYSNTVNNSPRHVYSFFFPSFSSYIYINYHIWKCTQTMLTAQQHHHTIIIFFSDFFSNFSSENTKLAILAIFSVHSGHWIPVPFCSSPFQGLFWCKSWNYKIPWQE